MSQLGKGNSTSGYKFACNFTDARLLDIVRNGFLVENRPGLCISLKWAP